MEIAVPNLKMLFELQEKLDERINKEKGITEDTSNLTVIAFKVEFAEFLNEHKFFKFWKTDKTPNMVAVVSEVYETNFIHGRKHRFIAEYKYPLLEEYVDGIHFLLSLGMKRKYHKYSHAFDALDIETNSLEYLAMEIFNNPLDSAGKWIQCMSDYFYFGHLVGITAKDIEEAYLKKNKINHERQDGGY